MTQKEKILQRLSGGAATRRDLCKLLQATNPRVETIMNSLVHQGIAARVKDANQPTWCRAEPSKALTSPWLTPTGMDFVRGLESVTFRNVWGVRL